MVRSSAAAFLGFAVAILLIVVGKDGGGGVWATRTDAQFAQCCTQHGVPQATKVCTYSITGMTQNKFNKLKAEGKVNDFFHCSMGNRDMTGCGRTVIPDQHPPPSHGWQECLPIFDGEHGNAQAWSKTKASNCFKREQVRLAWAICGMNT